VNEISDGNLQFLTDIDTAARLQRMREYDVTHSTCRKMFQIKYADLNITCI